ncbi:MAG: hypothetical protein M1294_05365 [Firmicutes bacterium]|nr:hypothetical protein [Bacillota bacterium]
MIKNEQGRLMWCLHQDWSNHPWCLSPLEFLVWESVILLENGERYSALPSIPLAAAELGPFGALGWKASHSWSPDVISW